MWDLPGSGIEHLSPALAGRFFTTEPQGKPCILVLYLVALHIFFLSSSSFLYESIEFLIHKNISSANNNNFYLFVSNLDVFYCFILSDFLAWIFNNMLNKSSERIQFKMVE